MTSKSFTLDLAGKTLTAQFTDLTEQTNGSVLLTLGDTVILVTATMSQKESDKSYFPLSVEFEERFYAAGAILGSRFQRREGRPSDEAILSARIIDRTIRPLFDKNLKHEIQVVVTVLAMGEDDPDVLGVIGASLALGTSDIPWAGPVGAVRIGRRQTDGEILINPSYAARSNAQLSFEVLACGQKGTLNMLEAAATEVTEPDMMAVLEATVALHDQLESWQQTVINEVGRAKKTIKPTVLPEEIEQLLTSNEYQSALQSAIFSGLPGKSHIYCIKQDFITAISQAGLEANQTTVDTWFDEQVDTALHEGALAYGKRADGRSLTEIRPLFAQAGGISPVLHGSGIFYRGGTHILSTLTLGGPEAAQLLDTIEDRNTKKRFLHHYNFPPYSVGETGRVGGFNRRMIGHGALAEKALLPVIPEQDDFPYTIRLVSETLSSNGSSSMGSVCASTLALMDGGVPIKRPVAGIAMGVMISGDSYAILTDIQGPEDEFGDMDLKVAGTEQGITAMQMDVKVSGVTLDIIREALDQAREARLQILATITNELSAPRKNISPHAPEIISFQINPDQIGLVIGSGGKTINHIKDKTGVSEITIEENGQIFITGSAGTAAAARDQIEHLTKEYQVGDQVTVQVVKLTNFGAFVALDSHHEGLIHISEIAPFHIDQIDSVLAIDEQLEAIVIKVADSKIGLSIKQIDPTFAERKGITEATVKN